MKNVLGDYLQNLQQAGFDLIFDSVVSRYGKFTIYCLIGPEENLIHVAFTPKKHDQARTKLAGLNQGVAFRKIRQGDFNFNKVFKDYFNGKQSAATVTIDSPFIRNGTPFQQRVWSRIAQIPYGTTITYRRLAELAGSPAAARATGTACGANPLPIIIPCHRVVAENGLGGFGGGISVKKGLLTLENADVSRY